MNSCSSKKSFQKNHITIRKIQHMNRTGQLMKSSNPQITNTLDQYFTITKNIVAVIMQRTDCPTSSAFCFAFDIPTIIKLLHCLISYMYIIKDKSFYKCKTLYLPLEKGKILLIFYNFSVICSYFNFSCTLTSRHYIHEQS